MHLPSSEVLKEVYGESENSTRRFADLAENFKRQFNMEEAEFFSAPGRTEIIGNHTDHNGGKILAASIDMDTIGAAWPNNSDIITIISEGYDQKFVVDLSALDQIPINQGTVSLVAGMAEAARKSGFRVSGFNVYVSTKVISAAGVSSSASFEMLICSIIDFFFNDNSMTYVDYAKIGQYAENHHWSKASGLMDQLACAVGGTILLNFSEDAAYEKVDFSFADLGYDIFIVNTGKGHADLSEEYSSIPREMKLTAKALGAERLADTSLTKLLENMDEVLKETGNDRAILRSIHFFEENRRVEAAAGAIERKDGAGLLKLLKESGDSSWKLLQNCYPDGEVEEQKIPLTLALSELFVNRVGDGCCRIHGGGFAGVIMCVVPRSEAGNYEEYISRFADKKDIYHMNIRRHGAIHLG